MDKGMNGGWMGGWMEGCMKWWMDKEMVVGWMDWWIYKLRGCFYFEVYGFGSGIVKEFVE